MIIFLIINEIVELEFIGVLILFFFLIRVVCFFSKK